MRPQPQYSGLWATFFQIDGMWFTKSIETALCILSQKISSVVSTFENSNTLFENPILSNYYLAVRHGKSLANVAKLIVSDPAVGCKEYGLRTLVFENIFSSTCVPKFYARFSKTRVRSTRGVWSSARSSWKGGRNTISNLHSGFFRFEEKFGCQNLGEVFRSFLK